MREETQTNEQNPITAILPGAIYNLEAFSAVTGMKKTALRTCRERGLKVHYVGNRGYIVGSDFADYLKEHGKESEPKK
jgi:hypothetical protein